MLLTQNISARANKIKQHLSEIDINDPQTKKALAASGAVAATGLALTAWHVSTLTTAAPATTAIAVTTVKAGLLTKVITSLACVSITACAAVFVYRMVKNHKKQD